MTKTLPIKHLSARVPWHDNKWNGSTCCNTLDNSYCRILPGINDEKTSSEPSNAIIEEGTFMPPCISEKGTFLSPYTYVRPLTHSWKKINPLFADFQEGHYLSKPFSFNAVPFLWMSKGKSEENHYSEKAKVYELDYKPDLEEEVDKKLGFKGNMWVQHPHNQRVLLDAFFNCIKKHKSLVFFYAKHTPFSEPNERVIVGVAKVKDVGHLLEYSFPNGYTGHKSYPWDRCVEHTLTNDSQGGFILPYHEIIEHQNKTNEEIDLREYAVFAPDHLQFSFSSELVEHDFAIDALLSMAESLRKSGLLLGVSYKKELEWIDNEISKIWDMRGAYPSLGSVLSALEIEDGNTIAWEIEKHILEKDGDLLKTDAWHIFEESIKKSDYFLTINKGEKLFNPTTIRLWKSIPSAKKEYLKLISRCQLNNDQAKLLCSKEGQEKLGGIEEVKANPYLIYEKLIQNINSISFRQVDKAMLPPEKLAVNFPLPAKTALTDKLDERRIRAVCTWILEEASIEGHALLPTDEILDRVRAKMQDEALPLNEDILMSQAESDFFKELIKLSEKTKQNPVTFFKLQRLEAVANIIRRNLNFERVKIQKHNIEHNWRAKIDAEIDNNQDLTTASRSDEENLARQEKAEALRVLAQYRFSVLIGPAGSGKTTLLKALEKLPEIQGSLLKLAPTGKARVKLGDDAKTLAQFLYPHRYDGSTGQYFINPDAPKSTCRNVIIDEASMLTEEQLAALFDALGATDRIILVGDYRQLPPIGTGRPFYDIIQKIQPTHFKDNNVKCGEAYAELCQVRRQKNNTNTMMVDVELSRCFGDSPTKQSIDILEDLASGKIKNDRIRLEKWYDSTDFRFLFNKVLREELDLKDAEKDFNRRLGATDSGDYQYFNTGVAEKEIENWQIISPVNGMGYGIKEINKFIQTTFRKPYIDLALNISGQKRKIAKPKGADGFVYGDKIINLKNTKWHPKQHIRPFNKKEEALNYIANGEIGIVTGEFKGKFEKSNGEPNVEIAFSTQQGYSYVFWANDLKEEATIDLAYAITVHKAQGSGFKTVFFVLPASGHILSRELLYTALTRQEERIIILHQGDFRDFLRLASTEKSATARRFTDLFHTPSVLTHNKKRFDAKYVNISERGEAMISKNEVIIANCLNKYKDIITYAYEDKLKLDKSNITLTPDFVIENLDTGRRFYWEHLGMMSLRDYREKWQLKLKAYLDNGFVLHNDATLNDDKVLIITEENPTGGIDSQYFDKIVRKVILEESI